MLALKVLWICMSIYIVSCQEAESQNLRSLLKSALAVCEMETKIDLDELKSLSVSQPLSHDLSCYVDCVMRKFDLIDDDKFSVDKANIYIDKLIKNEENAEETNEKKDILKRCVEENESETDSCLVSGAIFQCVGREFEEAGFINPHKISKRSRYSDDSEEQRNFKKKRARNFYVAYMYYNFLMNALNETLST